MLLTRFSLSIACATLIACASHIPEEPGSEVAETEATETEVTKTEVTETEGVSFGSLVGRYGSSDYDLPTDINALVDSVSLVASGEILDVIEGRRELLGAGTNPAHYRLWMHIVIRADEVYKGDLTEGNELYVEFSWPRNLSTDALSPVLPRGKNALVLGITPADIPDRTDVVANSPFGLVFETDDGNTVKPFHGDKAFHETFVSRTEAMDFEETLAAVSNAAKRNPEREGIPGEGVAGDGD